MNGRPKVLVSAYACEPGRGSEPGIGWNMVRQIARFCDTWVIARANNRAAIELALGHESIPGLQFVWLDLPWWARFWKHGRRGLYVYYYLWQIAASRLARRLHREIGFDLAQHVTFGAFWMPSFIAGLPVPFIWGPVGGGERTPEGFRSFYSFTGRVRELLRDAVQMVGNCDPFVRRTARRAVVALATTTQSAERLRALGVGDVRPMSAMGLPAAEIAALGAMPVRRTGPFRMAAVGLLLHWKGFELAIRSFAAMRATVPDAELWIVGDGPERARLASVARGLGLGASVKFLGSMPRAEVLRNLAECDVLVHPSLHDSGACVCTEALASGRPVICLDTGGPALQVTPECGFAVAPGSPRQAMDDLALAMQTLASNPELRVRMAEAARRRVREELCWDRKGEQLAVIFDEVLRVRCQAAPAAVARQARRPE